MPIYQYQCQECGHELEALQKMSDAKLTDCPACGAAALKKCVTAAAFRLKGSGWYETDFKNSGKPKTAKPESNSTASKESKTESGSAKSDASSTKKAS